ncbi:MAG: hypothetical protein Q8P68_04860 [Candidatus Peregrinibacteria bacterium]|nr:hypothetical protein [Candidatus Peregrinibacteria bacterium]MDZ4245381.1 hypothetical protein [Candidatus Gracilibacteria bacterium]
MLKYAPGTSPTAGVTSIPTGGTPKVWSQKKNPDPGTEIEISLNDPEYGDYLMIMPSGDSRDGILSPVGVDFQDFMLSAQDIPWHRGHLTGMPEIPKDLDLPSPEELQLFQKIVHCIISQKLYVGYSWSKDLPQHQEKLNQL